MSNKLHIRLLIISRFVGVCFVIGLILIIQGCTNSKIKKIDKNIDIEKINDSYNIIFDRDTEYEWKYYDVDSFAIIDGQVLIYGKTDLKKEKKWFYIAGGEEELKKGFGDWYDNEFRKYRLNEIDKNRELYKTIICTNDLWNKN